MKTPTREEAAEFIKQNLLSIGYQKDKIPRTDKDMVLLTAISALGWERECAEWVDAYPAYADTSLVMCSKCRYQVKRERPTNFCACCGSKMKISF